jgi:hypothetical protein
MSAPLPLRHLAIRVPWHDARWNGTICADPTNNASCLRLRNIHERRDDVVELNLRGTRLDEMSPRDHPPCLAERATFMADFSITRWVEHPYFRTSALHKHYRPTPVELPPYTAAALPFRWMLRREAVALAHESDLVFHDEAEDEIRGLMRFDSFWVQDVNNQRRMLDAFFSAIVPETSLAFFYAKEVPHTEKQGRVLIGAGWVTGYGPAIEYDYDPQGDRPTRSMIWERVVQHSIRVGTATGGFLLPYHDALARGAADSDFDPASIVVFAPDEAFEQYSYGSDHLSHDQAIASLLAMIEGLRRAEEGLGNDYSAERRWAQERLGELWKLRGPFPGLGSALTAFGVDHAHLFAYRVTEGLAAEADPWPAVQAALNAPGSVGAEWSGRVGPTLAKKLAQLPDERRALLRLLARFDLTSAQATRFYVKEERSTAGIDLGDAALLRNPYMLYEEARTTIDPIPVTVVDRGCFPGQGVVAAFPIPAPSAMAESQDPRRVRALMVSALEDTARVGHTVAPQRQIVLAVRSLPVEPPCSVDADLLAVISSELGPAVQPAQLADGTAAYQLERLANARERIRGEVIRRASGATKRHEITIDWPAALAEQLPDLDATDVPEVRARQEKAAALRELASARVAVLVGPAGTGKTTLLAVLCAQPVIRRGGVTLLAPTGKARVQLERGLGRTAATSARTIAQFLLPTGRYDPDTRAYQRSDQPPGVVGGTLIIDEASMLTEEQLDAVLDNVSRIERLILVGDPRQLPPIGPGRPFVDIVEHLRAGVSSAFPRVGPSYAELTVLRRQRPGNASDELRHDLALAQWFSGDAPSAEAEEVWAHVLSGRQSPTLRFQGYEQPTEVFDLLKRVVVEELEQVADADDQVGFGTSLGGSISGDYVYYNLSSDRYGDGAGPACEAWQILSPIRATGAGISELNRSIHRHFRADHIEQAVNADHRFRKVPKPMGPEGIVYGDKVMNNWNHRHEDVYPETLPENSRFGQPARFVANGEIGMVVGQFKRRGQNFRVTKLKVEFSTQPGVEYGYGRRYLPAEGDPVLELAYAITVHKSQGSEFGLTFVVIPNPCQLLSRELLYTALTRQTDRVVVLHQGPLGELLSFGSSRNSETARRFTNLFHSPAPSDVGGGRYMEERMIHRTANGTLVRSKSEVIVADALYGAGVAFDYERAFLGHDGTIRLPDFTIEDAATGTTYIWEHLGLLSDPHYAQAWQRKKAWYALSGVTEEGDGSATLIVTSDDSHGGIDSGTVKQRIQELLA